MKEALVFGGQNSLDFLEVRSQVVRIPEVSLRLEEAQCIWDKSCGSSFSFQHFLNAEDSAFFNNIHLKSLSLSVVQLGLLDRYKRHFGESDFLVGNTQNDSALMVAAGLVKFSELIEKSQAGGLIRPMVPLQIATEPVLRGHSLPQFQVFARVAEGSGSKPTELDQGPKYKAAGQPEISVQKILQSLIDDMGIKKIVHVGPGTMDKSHIMNQYEMRELQVYESIDIDPMLGWFWADLRKQGHEFSLAQ